MVFFVSQLIRYAQVGSKYEDFLFRGSILVSQELLTLSGTPDFTPFMSLLIRYTYTLCMYEFVSLRTTLYVY